jgi:hypothetical protein
MYIHAHACKHIYIPCFLSRWLKVNRKVSAELVEELRTDMKYEKWQREHMKTRRHLCTVLQRQISCIYVVHTV